jgi:hypothetical protein
LLKLLAAENTDDRFKPMIFSTTRTLKLRQTSMFSRD